VSLIWHGLMAWGLMALGWWARGLRDRWQDAGRWIEQHRNEHRE